MLSLARCLLGTSLSEAGVMAARTARAEIPKGSATAVDPELARSLLKVARIHLDFLGLRPARRMQLAWMRRTTRWIGSAADWL